jgi:hypothetical protein
VTPYLKNTLRAKGRGRRGEATQIMCTRVNKCGNDKTKLKKKERKEKGLEA